MIKKTFEKYSLSQKKKDALFERINSTITNTAVEEAEKEEESKQEKSNFIRYAAIAASVVLLTGITALIIHFATPGQQINYSTPQNNVFESNLNINSSDEKEEVVDPLTLPLYKDSAVIDMEPQKYGYTGCEAVRFAEKTYESYRFIVAGDFIRREEDIYETYLDLYVYKNDTLLGIAGRLNTGSRSMGIMVSRADVDNFETDFMTIIPMAENSKSYPLVALTVSDIRGHYNSLYYEMYRGKGFKTMTSFFSVVNDVPFKFGGSCELATWFPDFDPDKITVNGTAFIDHRGWESIFDFEKKTIHVGAIFYDDEKQKRLDNLLPFEDSNIPVYDGEMYLVQGMDPSPFADILIDEKTCGDYTFTLVSPMAKRTDMPDKYMTRWFHLIVSYKGRVLEDSYSAAVFDGAQYGMPVPKDYDFSSMLKVYTMKQNGIEYPLASVTYTDYEHLTDAGIKATSISRFFTVRNGMGEWFTDSSADYKNLPSDVVQSGLSLKDSANRKRITFDFEKRKATITELNNTEDIDIRQCPYYKDSAIYNDGSTAIGESEFVRFAEKEYVAEGKHGGNYKFIVGGKIEKAENGAFNVSLNMYLYRNDNLAGVQNALSNGGFDFTVSADDIEGFGDTVLDLKEFKYFDTTYPLAVVTAKPHSSILEDKFPSAGFTTVSNFFTVKASNISIVGAELALFYNGGMFYPDYTSNVTFREPGEANLSGSVMIDEKGWEVFFNPETLTAHITADKAYNVSIGIKGENYANKNLVMRRYPLIENEDILFTTDSNGKARFDSLLCGTYTITDEEGKNIIDDKSESITITFDNSNTETTITGSRDVLSLPLYEDSRLFGEDKYNTGVSENVRFAEVTYGEYRFIVAGKITRTTTDYYTAKPRVYVYKSEELIKDFGELYTGTKDGSVKILVQDAKKFTDNMLSVKTMTQNGKKYPLVMLAVKGNEIDNYHRITKLDPMDRDYTIPAFYSITDSGIPYQFTGYDDINLYSPVLDNNIIIKDNSITDGKEWTVAFDFEKKTASVIPGKVTNINITFKGNVSYGNKNFYLQEYTLTDKEKEIIHFTTDSNGKAHFDELPCLTYNIFDEQGNIVFADPHGEVFRVLESNLEDVWSFNLPGDNDAVAEELTIQFTGDSSYTNRGLLYLIKTDKAFLDSTDKLTYTDKDLSVVPSYSVSADGKVVLDKADVGYYIVTGPMFLPTNDNGFTVFEVTNKDSYKTISVDLNKADIGTDRVGMKEPEQVDPDDYWPDGMYEFCMQDITFRNEEYCAISIDEKWEQLENADGAYPFKISGDVYEEEIHRARQKNYDEKCEIYYNGIIYSGLDVYNNFAVREVSPKGEYERYKNKVILYIKKELKTKGDEVYSGSGFSLYRDVPLKDIDLKTEGINESNYKSGVSGNIVLNEIQVYMYQNGLNVEGYTDTLQGRFEYYGWTVSKTGEIIIPEDDRNNTIRTGYNAIVVRFDDENVQPLKKHPVYYIDENGKAEFKFWIEAIYW